MPDIEQTHLNYQSRVNFGSYYTNKNFVDNAWSMVDSLIDKDTIIIDTSCGYGNFLKNNSKIIGADIDEFAINKAKKQYSNVKFFHTNALQNVSRQTYNIGNNKLCIIGNPPYNDTTSIIRNGIKTTKFIIDKDIKTRDLGMSFLLSYQKLSADIICVLHPLSYLIKPANFNLLKKFNKEYRLKKAQIISSQTFKDSSKSMAFPIIIALYQKDNQGMDFDFIKDFAFKENNKTFKLNNFDTIKNYVAKYPNKKQTAQKDDILFWTMRDINALKRNQTFVKKHSANTIIIDKNKLDYYIYIDVFKQFSKHIPYYLGNCDVLINNDLFQEYKTFFILECLNRRDNLRCYFDDFDFNNQEDVDVSKNKIKEYLQKLLGVHYVY
jgi:hypothetical protein